MKAKEIFEEVLKEDEKEDIRKKIQKLKAANMLLVHMKAQSNDEWKKKECDEYKEKNTNKIKELEKQLKESLNEDKKQEAIKKLKMSDVAAKLAGGMTKEEARKFLSMVDNDDDEIMSD